MLLDPYSTAWAFTGWRDLDEQPRWARLPSSPLERGCSARAGARQEVLGVRDIPDNCYFKDTGKRPEGEEYDPEGRNTPSPNAEPGQKPEYLVGKMRTGAEFLEQVVHGLLVQEEPRFVFSSIEDEMDAVATWKRFSSFEVASEESPSFKSIVRAASVRGLVSVIIRNVQEGRPADFSVFVCKASEEWRIAALQALETCVLDAGCGWSDDFIRVESAIRGYRSE